ncbi:hypothetical protein B0H13DRAFT_2342283 [Mycena leptocephala]|nr:hypothetical protein B0H13DRAFT_2342283 [Mycena leptocephala]
MDPKMCSQAADAFAKLEPMASISQTHAKLPLSDRLMPVPTPISKQLMTHSKYDVVQYTSQLMGPLLIKALIHFAKARTAAKAAGVICQHQCFFRSMITGASRAPRSPGLCIAAPRTSHLPRLRLPNSAVLNHVSADLGPSALAGFALFLLLIPLQERIMVHQCALWQGSMKWTDEKAGTVLEVVASMRVVKSFCYERSFLARLFRIRTQELRDIRNIQHSQSAKRPLSIALAFSLPSSPRPLPS